MCALALCREVNLEASRLLSGLVRLGCQNLSAKSIVYDYDRGREGSARHTVFPNPEYP